MIKETASNNEVKETNSKPLDGFSNIRPEIEMTAKALNDAVTAELNYDTSCQEDKAPEKYLDDNGKEYRIGNELLPNTEFVINGYRYKTDDHGRVISAEGKLQKKDHKDRRDMDPRSAVNKGDMRTTDDRGHLIADRFNGSGGIENLTAMDSKLNQGDYATLEKKLADAVDNGSKVEMKVQPCYEKDSTRPSEFKVTYTIDGEKSVTVFKNGSGD